MQLKPGSICEIKLTRKYHLSTPKISVILVTYNSATHLPRCLSCLEKQTLQDFEVIVMDNDGSAREFAQNKLVTKYQFLDDNLGFAVANNLGIRLAGGKWIALLNADAFPEPDWLEKLLKAAEQNPEFSALSSRQVQFNAPHLLDGAGDAYHISGLAWRDAYNLPADKNGLAVKEIFSPCAAAALYSREAFMKAGGFDEDYFSYFEDVDLGFRLRLLGARSLYVPNAVVHHVGSASTGKRSDFSVYYGYRNLIWTFVKDMPSPWIWVLLPLHAVTIIFFAVYLSLRGQSKTIWKAIFDAVQELPRILEKRKLIQESRQVAPKDLFKVMSTGLFEPYQEFIRRNRSK